jgi:hypothetical protein
LTDFTIDFYNRNRLTSIHKQVQTFEQLQLNIDDEKNFCKTVLLVDLHRGVGDGLHLGALRVLAQLQESIGSISLGRVTRLGDFSPIWVILKITQVGSPKIRATL